MNETQPGRSARRFLVAAAVMEATAGALGFAGLALCTIAIASVARRRVATMEIPPAELARRGWVKAKAATSAGMGAWRGVPGGPRAGMIRRDREPARL